MSAGCTGLFSDLLPDNPRHLIPIKLNDRVLHDDLVLCTRTHPSSIIYPASAAPPPHIRTRPRPTVPPSIRAIPYHTIEHDRSASSKKASDTVSVRTLRGLSRRESAKGRLTHPGSAARKAAVERSRGHGGGSNSEVPAVQRA